MHLLLQTSNFVLLSYVEALLSEADIAAVVFDGNIGTMEGSIGAFPRRVMVLEADVGRARHALWEAGLGDELSLGSGP